LFCVGGGKGRQELLGVVNGNLSRAEVIDMAGDDAVRFRLKRRFMQYRTSKSGMARPIDDPKTPWFTAAMPKIDIRSAIRARLARSPICRRAIW